MKLRMMARTGRNGDNMESFSWTRCTYDRPYPRLGPKLSREHSDGEDSTICLEEGQKGEKEKGNKGE